LGLTEEEIQENEELWMEERTEPEAPGAQGQDLRGVGVNPADFESDIAIGGDMAGVGDLEAGAAGEPGAVATGAQPAAGMAPGGAPPPPQG
jgi:hypothetical protein